MSIAVYDSDGVTELTHFTQWDTNREIIIQGVVASPAPVCQFYNAHSKRALVVPASPENGRIRVPVPNLILQEGISLVIDIYRETQKAGSSDPPVFEGKAVASVRIPVVPKPQPEDYVYIENIIYASWVELSERAKAAIERIEQFDVRKNEEEQTVEYTVDGETWVTLFSLEDIRGDSGEINSVTATVDGSYGTPSVSVTTSGDPSNLDIALAFHNISGFSPVANITGTEDSVTISIRDYTGTTTQTLGRYAALLPTFDINPLTGELTMTAADGYTDIEFYIDESTGHLMARRSDE